MRILDFFTEWTNDAATAVNAVTNLFPCFVELKSVEMNWTEVTIKARQEDMSKIEILLAGIV